MWCGLQEDYLQNCASIQHERVSSLKISLHACDMARTCCVVQFLQHSNIRKNARLRSLYRDVRRRCIVFDNLHYAATSPLPSERCCQEKDEAFMVSVNYVYFCSACVVHLS